MITAREGTESGLQAGSSLPHRRAALRTSAPGRRLSAPWSISGVGPAAA